MENGVELVFFLVPLKLPLPRSIPIGYHRVHAGVAQW